MAKDLRILLSADLNEAKSVKDINSTLKKIQTQLIKIQVKIDTNALMAALKEFKTAANNAGKSASSAAGGIVNNVQYDLKQIRSAMQKINDEIGKSTPRKFKVTKDINDEIRSATVTYTNEMGKTITKNLGWVNEQVAGVTKSTFKQVSETSTLSLTQAENKMKSVLKNIQNLKQNLQLGRVSIHDQTNANNLLSTYRKLEAMISSALSQGHVLRAKTIKDIENEIRATKELTAQTIKQQKEVVRVANLGTQFGSTGGMAIRGASADALKSMVTSQVNSSNIFDGKVSNVSLNSNTVDPKTGKAVALLTVDIENGKNAFMRYKVKVDEATGAITKFGEGIRQTSNRNLSFVDKLKVAMQSIPIWMVGMTAFYQTLHFFSDGVGFVNDLNKALTELSIVFNTSQAGVAHYGKLFHDLALSMSMTTEEIANGAVEFARQGLTQQQMLDRMKIASMYAKISNIDFATSAKILTATVNSMGVSAERAADVFSYMGDATATGADEIGKAMQRVGGTAGSVGLEFEKLASWVAVVSSRTREGAETIGNAFKSIIARFQSIKETGFDEVDGTNFNQVSKALASVGIQAVDSNNQLRNFGEVMDDIGAKWDTLDRNQKAYLATTVAGTYQQSRFLNIMEGYDDSIKLYEESLTKAGTATQKFNRFQEGTEAHLNRLKTAWHGVFQSSFDSTGIQGAIDGLTSLALSIDSVVKNVGLIPIILGIAGTAFLVFSSKTQTAYMSLRNFLNTQGSISGFFTKLTTSIRSTIIHLDNLYTAGGRAAVASNLLKVSLTGLAVAGRAAAASLAAFALPMAGLMAVGFIIQKITDKIQANIEKQKQFNDMMKTISTNITSHRGVIDNLVESYKNLHEQTKGGTIGTTEDIEKYWQVSKDLSDMLPNMIDHIDAQGRAHLRNADAIEKELKVAEDLARAQANKTLGSASKTFENKRDDYNDAKENYRKAEDAYKRYKNTIDNLEKKGQPITEKHLAILSERQGKMVEKNYLLKASADEVKKSFNEVSDAMAMIGKLKFSDQIEAQIEKFIDTIDFSDKNAMTGFKQVVEHVGILQKSLDDAGSDFSKQKDAMDSFSTSVRSLGSPIGDVGVFINGMNLALNEQAEKAKKAEVAVMDYQQVIKLLDLSYEDASEKLSILNGLLDDNSKKKRISADEVMKLITKDAQMVDMFIVEGDQIKLNTEAIEAKKRAMITAFAEESKTQQKTLIDQNTVLVEKLRLWGIEIEAINNVGSAIDEVNKKYAEQYAKEEQAMRDAGFMGEPVNVEYERRKAVDFVKNMSDLQKRASLSMAALNTVGQDKVDPNGSGSGEGDVRPYDESNVKAYKINIEEINSLIKDQENYLSTLDKTSQIYRDGLREEIELQKQKQFAASTNADDLRDQLSDYEKQLASMGSFDILDNDGKRNYNNLRKQIDDTKKSILDMQDAWWDAYGKINSLKMTEVESSLQEFAYKIKDVDDAIEEAQAQQGLYKENSRKWVDEAYKEIEAMKQKQDLLHQQAEMIRENIRNGDLNAEQVRQLTEQARKLSIEWLKIEQTINKTQGDILRKRTDAANDIIDMMKDQLRKQKEMLEESYDEQIDALEKAHRSEMDILDKTNDGYEKLIETKKKAYEKVSDDRKYNQELAKKQQERQEIQNRINALSMDNSSEGQSKLRELNRKLGEINTDIENMQYDHNQKVVIDALDANKEANREQYENNKERLENDYKNKKEALEKEKKLNRKHIEDMIADDKRWGDLRKSIEQGHVADTLNGINTINSGWQTFVNTNAPLLADNLKKNLFDKVTQSLIDQKARVDELKSSFLELANRGDIVGQMQQNSRDWWLNPDQRGQIEEDQAMLGDKAGATKNANGDWVRSDGSLLYDLYSPTSAEEARTIAKMQENSKKWFNSDDQFSLTWENAKLGTSIGAKKDANGDWTKNGLKLYHKGGIVGGGGDKVSKLINDMFNASPNEQVVMALEDELMAPSKNITKNFIPNLSGLTKNIASKTSSVVTGGNTYNINIGSVTGDQKGADLVTSRIVKELKKLGKQF